MIWSTTAASRFLLKIASDNIYCQYNSPSILRNTLQWFEVDLIQLSVNNFYIFYFKGFSFLWKSSSSSSSPGSQVKKWTIYALLKSYWQNVGQYFLILLYVLHTSHQVCLLLLFVFTLHNPDLSIKLTPNRKQEGTSKLFAYQ